MIQVQVQKPRNGSTAHKPGHEHTKGRSNKLTVINAFESPTSRENGRHSRKGAVWVMFSMKSWHPTVVKLVDNVESKGCGNGVGRTGAVHGTFVLLEST